MTKPSKPTPTTGSTGSRTPVDPRSARARILGIRRALELGKTIDLHALHESFELLRDTTNQPHRWFALAVEEARLLDTATSIQGRNNEVSEALVAALARVLQAPVEGSDPDDLAWACQRLESALRSTIGRRLDPRSQLRALQALAVSHAHQGHLDRARKIAARIVRRAKTLVQQKDPTAVHLYDAALEQAFEWAVQAHDHLDALRWARARVEALRSQGHHIEPEVLASALEPLWSLWLATGRPDRALIAAQQWLQAEQNAAARVVPARPGRLLAAYAAVAQAAQHTGNTNAWLQAAKQWVDHARTHAREASPDDRPFASKRLAEALSSLHQAQFARGDYQGALDSAQQWLEVERSLGGVVETALPLVAIADAQAAMANWQECANTAEEVLNTLPPLTADSHGETALRAWLRHRSLALSVRAHFALGHYARALERGRQWLQTWLSGLSHTRTDGTAEALEAPTVITLVAQCEEPQLPIHGTPRRRAIQGMVTRAKKIIMAIETLPRTLHNPAALAAARAYLARAEWLSESFTMARRHAEQAMNTLRRREHLPREVTAFVAYVHESTRARHLVRRRAVAKADVVIASARALAAAQTMDIARTYAHLASLDPDDLATAPDALAHTLAACNKIFTQRAPSDPVLTEGLAAWREWAPYATLVDAQIHHDNQESNKETPQR